MIPGKVAEAFRPAIEAARNRLRKAPARYTSIADFSRIFTIFALLMNIWKTIWETLLEAGGIALLVAAMMMALSVVDYSSRGKVVKALKKSRLGQAALASLLGVVPGCMGGYFTVSMYSRGMLGFGALFAMMMATTGDEAFLMLAQFPKTALLIMAGLFVVGIIIGVLFKKNDSAATVQDTGEERKSLKARFSEVLPDAGKVFLWTFGIMLAVNIASQYIDLEAWVGKNTALMILLAVAIGFIPQSGPHMVFVTLFASGVLPLPVLLANCIVQDGHAGLPLLATDRKAFFRIKAIKAAIALAAAFIILAVF